MVDKDLKDSLKLLVGTVEERKNVYLYTFYRENKNAYMLLGLSLFISVMALAKFLMGANLIEEAYIFPLLLTTSIPLGITLWRSKVNRDLWKSTIKAFAGKGDNVDLEVIQTKYIEIAKSFPKFSVLSVITVLRKYFVWLVVITTIFVLPIFSDNSSESDELLPRFSINLIIGFTAAYLLSPLVTILKNRHLKKLSAGGVSSPTVGED